MSNYIQFQHIVLCVTFQDSSIVYPFKNVKNMSSYIAIKIKINLCLVSNQLFIIRTILFIILRTQFQFP